MEHRPRNYGMDVLRAAAIMMVLISHTLGALSFLGVYGVELFFVLSGFLIGDILIRSAARQSRFEWKDMTGFWTRRWFRTLPNYYWFLTLNLLVGWFAGTVKFGSAPRGLPLYLLFLQTFAWPSVSGFFGVAWSLAIEEWFYLLFPAAFYLLLRRSARPSNAILSGFFRAMLIFLLVPLALRFLSAWFYPSLAQRYTVILRLDAIMYGVMLAYLKSWHRIVWERLRKAWPVGVFGLLGSWFLIGNPLPVVEAVIFTMLPPSFMLILPVFHGFAQRRRSSVRIIEWISLWSYSIYLCHMLVYDEARAFFEYDRRAAGGRVLIKFGALGLAVAVSALNYRYFERPLTNLRERFGRERLLPAQDMHAMAAAKCVRRSV